MKRMMSQLLSLGVPLAIGFISQMAISFTDAVLVARIGSTELAGTTLALSLFSLVMLMGIGVITAVSPKVAENHRAEKLTETHIWYVQGVWLSLILGAVGVGILANTGWLLRFLGLSEELALVAQQYNNGAALGMPFFFFYVNTRSLMSAVGNPKPLTWIMIAAIPVNVVIGLVAIFGFASIPGMGVFGAGLSSTLIRILIAIASVTILLKGAKFRHLKPENASFQIDWIRIVELLKIGSPIGIRIVAGEGVLPLISFFIASYGIEATAAHAVGLRTVSLISVFALGFSSAATTISAWTRAQSDWQSLYSLRLSLVIIAIAYVFLVGSTMALNFEFIQKSVFALNSEATISMLWGLLPLILLTFLFDTISSMFNGYLVGLEDTYLPTVVITTTYWGVGLGLGLVLSRSTSIGFFGFWVSLVVSHVIVTAFNYFRAGMHIRLLRAHCRDDEQMY